MFRFARALFIILLMSMCAPVRGWRRAWNNGWITCYWGLRSNPSQSIGHIMLYYESRLYHVQDVFKWTLLSIKLSLIYYGETTISANVVALACHCILIFHTMGLIPLLPRKVGLITAGLGVTEYDRHVIWMRSTLLYLAQYSLEHKTLSPPFYYWYRIS